MFSLAIDGPGGAGKSTVAKQIARDLQILYLDTGAMYRALGLWMLKHNVDVDDELIVVSRLNDVIVDLVSNKDGISVYTNGNDVTDYIRTDEVSMSASTVSKYRDVRERLVKRQQEIASVSNVVAEGRDIGSVVLPDAFLKVYLDADPEVRARRRYNDMLARDSCFGVSIEDVLFALKKRDEQDMNRAESPLKRLPDALYIDSTDMSVQDVVSTIYEACVIKMLKRY